MRIFTFSTNRFRLGFQKTGLTFLTLFAFLLMGHGVKAQYCGVSTSYDFDWISSFSTSGAVSNVSYTATSQPFGSYDDLTENTIEQAQGLSFSFNSEYEGGGNWINIWVDWNNDSVFDDSAESIEKVYSGFSSSIMQNGTFVIPSTVEPGTYRLRVRGLYGFGDTSTSPGPCGEFSYGSTLDYTLGVLPAPSCFPPTALTASNLTQVSAELSWTSTGTLFDIQYAEYPFQLGDGEIIEDQANNYTLSGLFPDTKYQYYVRQDCDTDQSYWSGPYTFLTGYCEVSTTYTSDYTSAFSTSGAISNVAYSATTQPAGSYANLTENVIEQAQGLAFDFSTTYDGGIQGVNVWIDWNNDLVFDNTEESLEKVYSQIGISGLTKTGTITVPADVEPGTYRVRVRSQYGNGVNPAPCGEVNYGSTLDFTLEVLPAPSCFPPTALGVANTTYNSTVLTWTSEGTLFDIQYAEAPFEVGQGEELLGKPNNFLLTGLFPETAYQYYVRQDCSTETSYWSGPFNFYTGYCLPEPALYPTSYIINSVSTLGGYTNIANTTATPASPNSYGDFTDLVVSQSPGGEFTYSIVVPAYTNIEIWADLNQDLVFDADELIGAHPYLTASPVTFTGTIAIPADLALGDYRIRVRSRYYFQTTANPCAAAEYGETEDYTLSVIAPPACLPPTDLGVSAVTFENANLSWTSEGTSFEVQYGEAPLELGQGVSITGASNNVLIEGLGENTTYQYYVRQECDTEESLWAGPYTFYTGYCEVSTTSTSDYTSAFSTSGAITNVEYTATAQPAGAYADLTDNIIEQAQGLSFDFLTTYVGGSQAVNIWIDWNNDMTFDNSEGSTEKVYSVIGATGASKTGTITIPADVEVGNYRVRVRSQYGTTVNPAPCGSVNYGSTLDFTLQVLPAPSCFPPTALGVENTTYESTTLTWTSTGTSFDIQFAEAPFEVGQGESLVDKPNNYLLTGLQPETAYQYYVRQNCTDESSFWSGPYDFYTGYCVPPASTSTTSYIINGMSTENGYTNISNMTATPASAGSYGDFTDLSVSQSPGGSFSYSVVVPTYTNVEVWIDYNQDLVFDADELVDAYPHLTTGPVTFTGEIALPADLPLGDYRMRVRSRYYFQTTANPCASAQYGETEDYTITVIAPPACLPPSGLSVDNLTATSVDLSWTSEGTSFEVQWGEAPFSLGQGTIITATNPITLELTESTTYQYYVRQNCESSSNGYSLWAGPFAFTSKTPGQIGEGTSINSNFPITSCYGYSYSQQIYLATELQAVLEPNSTLITEIRFKPASLPGAMTNSLNWDIYLGNTSKSVFSSNSDWISSDEVEQVYSGNLYFEVNEWVSIVLNTPFIWDGTSNIVVGVHEKTSDYNCTAEWSSYEAGSNRGISYYSDTTNPNPETPPTSGSNFSGPKSKIAQIQFAAEVNLGTGNFDKNSFTAYPNPVKDILNLSFTQNISTVAVYNLLGQQVLFMRMNANKGQVDMSSLATGTYLVKVNSENAVKTVKVIKE